jgi:hypothetical protein
LWAHERRWAGLNGVVEMTSISNIAAEKRAAVGWARAAFDSAAAAARAAIASQWRADEFAKTAPADWRSDADRNARNAAKTAVRRIASARDAAADLSAALADNGGFWF